MIEIRLHGRGGQGAVTAAEFIATAAFYDGQFAQAFPNFGVERRGAPVEAFVRLDDRFIRLREQVYHPDYIIIQDASLIEASDIFHGVKKTTQVIINTEKDIRQLPIPRSLKALAVPATHIALETLGKPIVNTAILGAFAGFSGLIKPESIEKAILERFSGDIGKKNIKAMELAFCHSDPKNAFCYSVKKKKLVKLFDRQRLIIEA